MQVAFTSDDNLRVLSGLKKGDSAALELLFKKFFNPLARFSFNYVKDQDAAKDIVQEVFYQIWNKREELPETTNLSAYLFTAIRNRCLNVLSQVNNRQDILVERERGRDDFYTDSRVETKELSQKIERAIDSLPEKCREVFLLSRYENKSYKEIAEILDISVKTVENHMGKALSVLRAKLLTVLGLISFLFYYIK